MHFVLEYLSECSSEDITSQEMVLLNSAPEELRNSEEGTDLSRY